MQDPWWNLHIPPGIPTKMRNLCIPCGISARIYTFHLGSQAGFKSHAGSLVEFTYPTWDLGSDLSFTLDISLVGIAH